MLIKLFEIKIYQSIYSLGTKFLIMNLSKIFILSLFVFLFESSIFAHDHLHNHDTTVVLSHEEAAKLNKNKLNFFDVLRGSEENYKVCYPKDHRNYFFSIFGLAVAGILLGFLIIVQKTRNNEALQRKKKIIEEKNKEILAGITYAKRIQEAILPNQKLLNEKLNNPLVFYKPKDIVAGDFYWMENSDDVVLFAACDCTGHGVSGAFISLVAFNALNQAVREFKLQKPSEILNKVNEIIDETFSKSEEDVKDGMDIALCAYNPKKALLEYAGANNPLWILKNGNQFIEIKADRQPIGKYEFKQSFTNHQIELENNDQIFLFSDGFKDQFGSKNGKKLKSSGFRKILESISHLNLIDQKKQLEIAFNDWKGNLEQVDDVCIVSIKI